jgi:4-hydroxybenzoate polyprenyltransferase
MSAGDGGGRTLAERVALFVELVRLEQTLFALPFAYAGMLLAQRGVPALVTCFWVTVAMFGARTAGMSANRLIDRHIDAANPRTADRSLPQGRVSGHSVTLLLLGSLGLLALAARQLNPLCYQLWPLAALLLLGYSYTKRFTWLCHAWLGLVQACAPIGGWLAVKGEWGATPLLLGLAIFCWVAGFDVLYACQDLQHDREVGLNSVPARFGAQRAFAFSRALHAVTWACLWLVGYCAGLGWVYAAGCWLIAALLVYEHRLLRPDDLSKMQQAFFQANVAISLTLLGSLLVELYR